MHVLTQAQPPPQLNPGLPQKEGGLIGGRVLVPGTLPAKTITQFDPKEMLKTTEVKIPGFSTGLARVRLRHGFAMGSPRVRHGCPMARPRNLRCRLRHLFPTMGVRVSGRRSTLSCAVPESPRSGHANCCAPIARQAPVFTLRCRSRGRRSTFARSSAFSWQARHFSKVE